MFGMAVPSKVRVPSPSSRPSPQVESWRCQQLHSRVVSSLQSVQTESECSDACPMKTLLTEPCGVSVFVLLLAPRCHGDHAGVVSCRNVPA
jgi:hypothetical protein